MKFQLYPDFYAKFKKLNVRVKNSFWDKIKIFERNPNDPVLDNHSLHKDFTGYRSIDITDDDKYVAIYEELNEGDETIAYFFEIGLKKELYK